MKKIVKIIALTTSIISIVNAAEITPEPSNGINYPTGWQDWKTIAVTHRTDNKTIRLILGNSIAIKAVKSNTTNPWPDGAILGKVVWKDTQLKEWKSATAPAEFVHAEFMYKDSKKYSKTHNWGWARWVGLKQEPFQKGMQACITCHVPVEGNDWVYNTPAVFPK